MASIFFSPAFMLSTTEGLAHGGHSFPLRIRMDAITGTIDFMERRKNARLPLRLSGQLSLEYGQDLETETKDISLRGARLDTVPDVLTSRHCILTLFADSPEVFSVTIDATIVHLDENGCGIEFQSMDERDFELFRRFIERQARDKDALHDEIEEGQIPNLKDWSNP